MRVKLKNNRKKSSKLQDTHKYKIKFFKNGLSRKIKIDSKIIEQKTKIRKKIYCH